MVRGNRRVYDVNNDLLLLKKKEMKPFPLKSGYNTFLFDHQDLKSLKEPPSTKGGELSRAELYDYARMASELREALFLRA